MKENRLGPPAAATGLRGLLLRRIWLPGAIYRALPWAYLLAGAAALGAAVALPDPDWLAPYLVLLGISLIHGAAAVTRLRRRRRLAALRQQRERRGPGADILAPDGTMAP